jgi:hypothetical protein
MCVCSTRFELVARPMTAVVIRPEDVRAAIVAARGLNVMLDSDLARLYEVQTSALVRAMKRNQDRFPIDFAFQLTREEWDDLLCQSGIASSYGGRRTAPFVFTEQGVAMLSGVLRSERAVAVNVAIMRAFVAMRHELRAHVELARRLDEIEEALGELESSSAERFQAVFDALRSLLIQPTPLRKVIGFTAEL